MTTCELQPMELRTADDWLQVRCARVFVFTSSSAHCTSDPALERLSPAAQRDKSLKQFQRPEARSPLCCRSVSVFLARFCSRRLNKRVTYIPACFVVVGRPQSICNHRDLPTLIVLLRVSTCRLRARRKWLFTRSRALQSVSQSVCFLVLFALQLPGVGVRDADARAINKFLNRKKTIF